MDPAVLIFLLYIMIAHELVCGWIQYRRQRNKSHKAAGPVPHSRFFQTGFLLEDIIALKERMGHVLRQRANKFRKKYENFTSGNSLSGWVYPRTCQTSKRVTAAARGGRDLRKCGRIIRKA